MFIFPKGFYVDVRIERIFETSIKITLNNLDDMKEKKYQAAFIRLFDGKLWYYSSTTNVDEIQKEIDNLVKVATPYKNINNHPFILNMEINNEKHLEFNGDNSITNIDKDKKLSLLKSYSKQIDSNEYMTMWQGFYVDKKETKHFYSSKGSNIIFDVQTAGVRLSWDLSLGDKKFSDHFDINSNNYSEIENLESTISEKIKLSVDFLLHSKPVKPGDYTVVLSPLAAGIFAHESFGHKSEADFMVGDETMRNEWTIGKKVGSSILSIIDSGTIKGSGYTPFDDEGTRAKVNYLIKKGKLTSRLHNATTAALLEEKPTGNARAMNFEYEPIVRMTTTYIEKGDSTFIELIKNIKEGIFVDTIRHGSGMTTFTLAPLRSYMIRNGKISEPVQISVVTGNVFETLNEIDGLSDSIEIPGFTMGGCGKMEQWPLRVGFGGPSVRVKKLSVQ